MNVYDFDKTIYPGDSATHFWWFLVRRHPAALPMAAGAIPAGIRCLTEKSGDARQRGRLRGQLKERLFAVLRRVPDPEGEVTAFWDSHLDRVYPWYINRRREDDVVISASPEFLIAEACRRLGIACIATPVEMTTGELRGPNCWGPEKPRRFRETYGDAPVEEFYSDSYSDRPMMELAREGFLMKNGRVVKRVSPPSEG